MVIRHWSVGAGLLCASVAIAQNHTYTVKRGESLSEIASKLGVNKKSLMKANGLTSHSHVRAGRHLAVPGSGHRRKLANIAGGYVVRNGDCDWTIAHKFDTTVPKLHALNPDIRWSALAPGAHLNVPGAHSVHLASRGAESSVHRSSTATAYKVRHGDNDWIIAKHVGTTVSALRRMNPGIRWSSIQPGQRISVPGSASADSSLRHVAIYARHVVISTDNVTLRRGPSTRSESVTTVDTGTRANVVDRVNGWYKLKFPKGTVAWVKADYVHPTSMVVASSSRHHRRSRSTVAYHSRRRRYGHSTEVAMDFSDVSSPVLKKASSYRGIRYRYGGTSRAGFDCSGFVQSAYGAVGVHLPRSSREMAQTGHRVSKTDLKPGDLVFFHTGRGSRISHVAIYAGNGKIIHSSSGGGKVQINSLSDGYYARHYSTAVRVSGGHAKKKKAKKS